MTSLIIAFIITFGLIINHFGMKSSLLKKNIINISSVALWVIIYLLLFKEITNNYLILIMPIIISGLMLITALTLERIPLKRRKKNIYKDPMQEIINFIYKTESDFGYKKVKTSTPQSELTEIQFKIAGRNYLDEMSDEEQFIAKFFDANYGDLVAKAISLVSGKENISEGEQFSVTSKIYTSFDNTVIFVRSQFTEATEESNNKIKEELNKTLNEFDNRILQVDNKD